MLAATRGKRPHRQLERAWDRQRLRLVPADRRDRNACFPGKRRKRQVEAFAEFAEFGAGHFHTHSCVAANATPAATPATRYAIIDAPGRIHTRTATCIPSQKTIARTTNRQKVCRGQLMYNSDSMMIVALLAVLLILLVVDALGVGRHYALCVGERVSAGRRCTCRDIWQTYDGRWWTRPLVR